LESALRDLGEMSGNNLFVNIGRLDDPEYDKIRNHFGIKPLPVIVITADPNLASPLDTYATGFVRIDSKTLLNSPERTINCVQEVLNLFLGGEISKAISLTKWKQWSELLRRWETLSSRLLRAYWITSRKPTLRSRLWKANWS